MRSLVWVLASLYLIMGSSTLKAADGSSGCGPAWWVLKENSLVSSVSRALVHGILFPSTTLGMTFGTSNCTKHKIVQQEKRSLHLLTASYHQFLGEIARGEGQHLEALATTMGCHWTAQSTFNAVLQNRYEQILPNDATLPEDLLGNIFEQVLSHRELAKSCAGTVG